MTRTTRRQIRPSLDGLEPRALLTGGLRGMAPPTAAFHAGHRISDPQKANLEALAGDLTRIASESEITRDQVATLVSTFDAAFGDANRPDPETVQALVTETKDALADGHVTPREAAAIAADFGAVLAGANVDPDAFAAVVDAAGAVVASSNVDAADLAEIAGDLAAIRDEFLAHHGG